MYSYHYSRPKLRPYERRWDQVRVYLFIPFVKIRIIFVKINGPRVFINVKVEVQDFDILKKGSFQIIVKNKTYLPRIIYEQPTESHLLFTQITTPLL